MAIDQTWIVLKAFVNLHLLLKTGENILKYQLSLISFNIRYDRLGKIQLRGCENYQLEAGFH